MPFSRSWIHYSPEQVSEKVIMDLLTNYSNEVNLVEWKALNYDYNGQFGIVHDCLYRHMHEADYLAFIDLDEMIIPMRHLNWSDMLDDLEKRGGKNYAGYSGTSEKGTLWDQYKFKWFVPFIEVVLF